MENVNVEALVKAFGFTAIVGIYLWIIFGRVERYGRRK